MARRRTPARTRATRGSLAAPGRAKNSPATARSPWPTLESFVLHDGGQITIGEIGPVECAAVASDDHNMQVALQRRANESLAELLQRLDAALKRALEEDVFIDEING